MSLLSNLAELNYWRKKFAEEGGNFKNSHYEKLYKIFSVDLSSHCRILDFGCGPRGSLSWRKSRNSYGYDPLSKAYKLLFGSPKDMYMTSSKSDIQDLGPYDIVSAFNSLDHVDDLKSEALFIDSILRVGGSLLIIVELNHPPTKAEPQSLKHEFWQSLWPNYSLYEHAYYKLQGHDIHGSVLKGEYSWDGNVWRGHLIKFK